MARTCLFCTNETDNSLAHVVPSAIGGRKTSREIECSECNNRFGSTIEEELIVALAPFTNLLAIIPGRNKYAPTIKKVPSSSGHVVDLRPGATPTARNPTVSWTPDGQKVAIKVPANRPEMAKQLLEGELRKRGLSAENIRLETATVTSEPVGHVRFSIAIGGPGQFRAAAKLALCVLASCDPEVARGVEFATLREYINEGSHDGREPASHGYSTEFNISDFAPSTSFQHVVAVVEDPDNDVTAGHVTLYGHFRFIIMMGACARESPRTIVHRLDPLTGEHSTDETQVGDSRPKTEWDQRPQGVTGVVEAFDEFMPKCIERMQKLARSWLVDLAVTEAIELDDASVITEEMLSKLSTQLAVSYVSMTEDQVSKREMSSEELGRYVEALRQVEMRRSR